MDGGDTDTGPAPSTLSVLETMGLARPAPARKVIKVTNTTTSSTTSNASKKERKKPAAVKSFKQLMREAQKVSAEMMKTTPKAKVTPTATPTAKVEEVKPAKPRVNTPSSTIIPRGTQTTSALAEQRRRRLIRAGLMSDRGSRRSGHTNPDDDEAPGPMRGPGSAHRRGNAARKPLPRPQVKRKYEPVVSGSLSVASLTRQIHGKPEPKPKPKPPRKDEDEDGSSSRASSARGSLPADPRARERYIDTLAQQGDYRAAIRAMYSRDSHHGDNSRSSGSRYRYPDEYDDYDDDDDLSDMEVSASQIRREEARSKRIAVREDLEDEEEERRRLQKR